MRCHSIVICTILVIFQGSLADIECNYCGLRALCPLPYSDKVTERVTCAKSCMKFDGYSSTDNKRVLIRDCGEVDINECKKNVSMWGAIGTSCLCNGPNCNSASQIRLPWIISIGLIILILSH